MHRCARFIGMAALFLWAVSFADARSAAKTPADLVSNLVTAAHQGDVEGFLSGLTASSRKAMTQSFSDRESLRGEQQKFLKALDERFGKGAMVISAPEGDIRTALMSIVSAEVLEEKPGPGGTVQLRVKASLKGPDEKTVSREDTLIAQREGGAWKLVLGFAPDDRSTADAKAAIERLTKGVVEGQFKDRMSAMISLSNALSAKGGAAR
jgi:hypothetical protein